MNWPGNSMEREGRIYPCHRRWPDTRHALDAWRVCTALADTAAFLLAENVVFLARFDALLRLKETCRPSILWPWHLHWRHLQRATPQIEERFACSGPARASHAPS